MPNSAPLVRDCMPVQASRADILTKTVKAPSPMLNTYGKGPMEVIADLRRSLPSNSCELASWRKRARVAAVLGSGPRSLASMKSGRHWIEYIRTVYPCGEADAAVFPPLLDDILGWSHTFRCDTFAAGAALLTCLCFAGALEPFPIIWDI